MEVEKKTAVADWNIPALRPDRLSTVIPSRVYGGGSIDNPADLLFLWRSCASEKARGATLAFYVDDWRLTALWRHPATYAKQFKQCGVQALIEIDFSLWSDMSVAEQIHNVFKTRTVSRIFQGLGLSIIPNLSWATEESFPFCFQGIPSHAPVVACECRTPGSCDEDRRRFLAGLSEAVKQVEPAHIIIYGGIEHRHWLTGNLPQGPQYTLIEAFMTARGRIRVREEREAREKNQLNLFGGKEVWVEEAQVA